MVRLTAIGTLAYRLTNTTFDHSQVPLLRSAIGRGSLRLTRVGVVVDVTICNVSVAVLRETDSIATCQRRSKIGADCFYGKLRYQQPRSGM